MRDATTSDAPREPPPNMRRYRAGRASTIAVPQRTVWSACGYSLRPGQVPLSVLSSEGATRLHGGGQSQNHANSRRSEWGRSRTAAGTISWSACRQLV